MTLIWLQSQKRAKKVSSGNLDSVLIVIETILTTIGLEERKRGGGGAIPRNGGYQRGGKISQCAKKHFEEI